MNPILTLAVAIVLSGSAFSQGLSEDFSSGVPPTGWTHVNNNGVNGQGWIADAAGRAWHADVYLAGFSSENTMVSPTFDLIGVSGSTLTFDGQVNFATHLANNPAGYGDGISNMEISTDGGLTWTVVWTDTSLANGAYVGNADLSAYDGMSGLTLGVYYFGTHAHEWWVDNIVVGAGGGPGGPVYAITGLVGGGLATLTVSGCTPSGSVLIGYSLTGAGPTMTPLGMVDMSMPITQLPALTADAAGVAAVSTSVPAQASGFTVYTQAADLTSGALSNSLAEAIL